MTVFWLRVQIRSNAASNIASIDGLLQIRFHFFSRLLMQIRLIPSLDCPRLPCSYSKSMALRDSLSELYVVTVAREVAHSPTAL
jgi:hypothetical protein